MGLRIRALREKRDVTQEGLADLAKLDAKHVQLIEAGKTNATVASLAGIAAGLKLPLKDLFEGV